MKHGIQSTQSDGKGASGLLVHFAIESQMNHQPFAELTTKMIAIIYAKVRSQKGVANDKKDVDQINSSQATFKQMKQKLIHSTEKKYKVDCRNQIAF